MTPVLVFFIPWRLIASIAPRYGELIMISARIRKCRRLTPCLDKVAFNSDTRSYRAASTPKTSYTSGKSLQKVRVASISERERSPRRFEPSASMYISTTFASSNCYFSCKPAGRAWLWAAAGCFPKSRLPRKIPP